ncbi:MAG: acetyl-CoA carboxylase biotin carboxyl carrier protein [Acidobacteriota bacterium]
MNLKEIKDLIDLITEKNLAEFEMEKAGFKIKVVRAGARPAQSSMVVQSVPDAAATANVTNHAAPVIAVPATAHVSSSEHEGLVSIRSPIVGTFYRAPEPNAPPFVNEGDRVTKGQALCIIEAMKLMNELEAETDGEIVKILAENGQPVEYGHELFLLRPLP